MKKLATATDVNKTAAAGKEKNDDTRTDRKILEVHIGPTMRNCDRCELQFKNAFQLGPHR